MATRSVTVGKVVNVEPGELAAFDIAGTRILAAPAVEPLRSTKNPSYRDVRYVEELIGPDTVTTLTLATMEAFRKHGRLRASLEEHLEHAHRVIDTLERLDISLTDATDKLLENGVAAFTSAFDRLLASVRQAVSSPADALQSIH